MKKYIILSIIFLLSMNVYGFLGDFTDSYETDIYYRLNASDHSNFNTGGVARFNADFTGTSDNVTLQIIGSIDFVVMNGSGFGSAYNDPNLWAGYIRLPITGITYNEGAGTNYGYLSGTSLPISFDASDAETTITVTNTSIRVDINKNISEIPSWEVNESSFFRYSLGFSNTAQGNGTLFVKGINISSGSIVKPNTGVYPANWKILDVTEAGIDWDSGLTSTTSTTTTTTSTTTTILGVNSIDINITIDLADSGEVITNYKAYVWDCPDDSYFTADFNTRFFDCNFFTPSIFFEGDSLVIENLTGDKNYIVEAKRSSIFITNPFTVNPNDYSFDELVPVPLELFVHDHIYHVGFISTSNSNQLLGGVEYKFWDDNILVVNGTSTIDEYVNFNHTEKNFLLTYQVRKVGYNDISLGEESSNIDSGLFGVIPLTPNNNSFVSVAGYVIENSIGVSNAPVLAFCRNGYDYDTTTDATGFYNLTGISEYVDCDVLSDVENKINQAVLVETITSDINDINLTLGDTKYNNSVLVIVQERLGDNLYSPVEGISVLCDSQCGTNEKYSLQTNVFGSVSFSVKEDECDYLLTVNPAKINEKYLTVKVTKYSGDKLPILVTLPTLDDALIQQTFVCRKNGVRLSGATAIIYLDNTEFGRGKTDSEGSIVFDVPPGEIVSLECINNGEDGSDDDSEDGGGDSGRKDIKIPDNPEGNNPPIPIDIGDTDDSVMLDDLWTIVTNATEFFQWMLIIVILTMGIKVMTGFTNSIGGK